MVSPQFSEHSRLLRLSACIIAVLLPVAAAAQSSTEPSPGKNGQTSSSERPAFDDEPHFSVSGVKDTSNLGGHGSDTMVRTRDSLAKQTAALGKSEASSQPAALPATLESLRQTTEREPNNAAAHHALADAEEKSGDFLAAVREYERAAELDARENYIFDWGSDLLLHHAPEPAIEVFAKGHRVAPRSARMLIGLGAAEYTLGNSDRAVQEIDAAADLNPSDPAPYLFLAKMLEAEASPSEALTEKLRRFVSLQPDRADANYYYALALSKHRKDSPGATATKVESLLDRAIQLDPNYGAAYLERGILCVELGNDAKAIADYQKAIALGSPMTEQQTEEAHYRLAQTYRRIGEEVKAKAEIQIYEQLTKESQQQAERERHEIRQFVYTLRDQHDPP